MHRLKYIAIFWTLIFCNSCGNKTKDSNKSVEDWVHEWNKAHMIDQATMFNSLYDDSVQFYGIKHVKRDCIQKKISYFKAHPDYKQEIIGPIEVSEADSSLKCSFTKTVTIGKSKKDYRSYLIFSFSGKIIAESDLVTDSNLEKAKKIKIPENAIRGDFNDDGILDYAWGVNPKMMADELDCEGGCTSYVQFSDPSIPSIKIENSIMAEPTNLGDLNEDGFDEIGVLQEGFSSCWKAYHIYTRKTDKWILAVDPFSTYCNQWAEGIKPVEAMPGSKGKILIRFSEMKDEEIVVSSKQVQMK